MLRLPVPLRRKLIVIGIVEILVYYIRMLAIHLFPLNMDTWCRLGSQQGQTAGR